MLYRHSESEIWMRVECVTRSTSKKKGVFEISELEYIPQQICTLHFCHLPSILLFVEMTISIILFQTNGPKNALYHLNWVYNILVYNLVTDFKVYHRQLEKSSLMSKQPYFYIAWKSKKRTKLIIIKIKSDAKKMWLAFLSTALVIRNWFLQFKVLLKAM